MSSSSSNKSQLTDAQKQEARSVARAAAEASRLRYRTLPCIFRSDELNVLMEQLDLEIAQNKLTSDDTNCTYFISKRPYSVVTGMLNK